MPDIPEKPTADANTPSAQSRIEEMIVKAGDEGRIHEPVIKNAQIKGPLIVRLDRSQMEQAQADLTTLGLSHKRGETIIEGNPALALRIDSRTDLENSVPETRLTLKTKIRSNVPFTHSSSGRTIRLEEESKPQPVDSIEQLFLRARTRTDLIDAHRALLQPDKPPASTNKGKTR